MFRKIVSNLAFSPAVIGDLAQYAKKVKQEESRRRIGMVFVGLTLVVQYFAVFSPPESANAASQGDLIRGGVADSAQLTGYYDANTVYIKDVLSSLGITRQELIAVRPERITPDVRRFIWNRQPSIGTDGKESAYHFQQADGKTGLLYTRPLDNWNTFVSTYDVLSGQSSTLGWFAFVKTSGDLLTTILPASIGKQTTALPSGVNVSLRAFNLSKAGTPAEKTRVEAGQRLAWQLTVANSSASTFQIPLTLGMSDILEYAGLFDAGGAEYDKTAKTITWPAVTMPPGSTQSRIFVVEMMSPLPAAPRGETNPLSYDCRLTAIHGTTISVPVACPPAKAVENLLAALPRTGMPLNLTFASTIFTFTLYFYARSRLLLTEIRLIRYDLHHGTL